MQVPLNGIEPLGHTQTLLLFNLKFDGHAQDPLFTTNGGLQSVHTFADVHTVHSKRVQATHAVCA